MKKKHAIILITLLVITTSSCHIVHKDASGPVVTKQYQVAPFTGIHIYGPHDVYFEQADSFKVYAIVQESRQNELIIETNNSVLEIHNKEPKNVIRIGGGYSFSAEIHIQAPSLSTIKLIGSGDFTCKSPLNTKRFVAHLSGSGDITLDSIDCQEADFSLAGSGDIKARILTAKTSNIQIAGSGDITMKEKGVTSTNLSIAGSGDITMAFDDCYTATAQIAGSGEIKLQGTLQELKEEVSGSGNVLTNELIIRKP